MSLLRKVALVVVGLVVLNIVVLAVSAWSTSDSIGGTPGARDVLVLWLVVGAASGAIAGRLARDKGHDFLAYFLLGLFLPLVGVIVAMIVRPTVDVSTTEDRER